MTPYIILSLFSTFLASISQVMLKKEAMKPHKSWLREYLNPLVIFAYLMFIVTTFLSVYIYKGLPLSLGPILEASSYIYITIFGVLVFSERLTYKKVLSLLVIVLGICIYSLG